MRNISDDDLTLLFYGEHEDPNLPATVAQSVELSARFDALSEELRLVDNFVPPERQDDYGVAVWQRISSSLVADPVKPEGWLNSWLPVISQPRFSMAGVLSLLLVAVLAFTVGRNAGQNPATDPTHSTAGTTIALTGLDTQRLLTHLVSAHLEQVNLVLTQFVNSAESPANEAEFATDMLIANRLYRQAAATQGKHQLAIFLANLEPLLIELAYNAHSGSAATRERMQQEVKNGLLFRVRVMNKQLKKPQISV